MHHYVKIALVLCSCLALTTAQYGPFFSDFANAFAAAPSPYSNSFAISRDPRSNTGPVLFPASPSGDSSQSSGVIVGASGYGFVPPNARGNVGHHYGR